MPSNASDSMNLTKIIAQAAAKRLKKAADMGDVTALTSIAEELKNQSELCIPLSNRIVELTEDFDFDGILKLAQELESNLG